MGGGRGGEPNPARFGAAGASRVQGEVDGAQDPGSKARSHLVRAVGGQVIIIELERNVPVENEQAGLGTYASKVSTGRAWSERSAGCGTVARPRPSVSASSKGRYFLAPAGGVDPLRGEPLARVAVAARCKPGRVFHEEDPRPQGWGEVHHRIESGVVDGAPRERDGDDAGAVPLQPMELLGVGMVVRATTTVHLPGR